MFTLEIVQDNDPENPVAEDHFISTLAMFHKRYTLGNQNHGIPLMKWEDMESHIWDKKDAAVVLPIYMYDHSGITIRHTPFSCPWDSGQVGFGYITKEQLRATWGWKYITKKRRELAEQELITEIKIYDKYLTGDVWGYVIKDEEGEEIDACWGIFGYEEASKMGNEALVRLLNNG